MSLKDQLNEDMKAAMKAKDAFKRDMLRGLNAAIKQVEIDKQTQVSDEDVLGILQKEVKRREETISELEKMGRDADQERQEIAVIQAYLPEQLSREEVEALAREAIEASGAQGPADMGKVMGQLMPKVKGRADGKVVSDVVKSLLSA
jgi:uncharacterized protein YqeY